MKVDPALRIDFLLDSPGFVWDSLGFSGVSRESLETWPLKILHEASRGRRETTHSLPVGVLLDGEKPGSLTESLHKSARNPIGSRIHSGSIQEST